MPPQLTIQVVGWNSAPRLRRTLPALRHIPASQAVIRYIDNNSNDDSVAVVQTAIPRADVIRLSINRGFAGAHNIGFGRCTTPYVLTCDPDVTLVWSGLRSLLDSFADGKVGAVQGKLYRTPVSTTRAGGLPVIDSTGIVTTLSLNGKERGANQVDHGQYSQPSSLWAVTGACGLYRLAALRAVADPNGQIFDEDFFAYKEDVDIGWRLHKAGWRVQYVPVVVGWHDRTLGRRGMFNWSLNPVAILRRLGDRRTRYSIRNWVWMLVKNITPTQLITREIFIDGRLLVLLCLSLFKPSLLTVWWETARGLPRMIGKRHRGRGGGKSLP